MAAAQVRMHDQARKPVFISYARDSMRDEAMRLHRVLTEGGLGVFLDTASLTSGDEISEGILDAALAARVMVVFLDRVYLSRWYCVRELMVAAEAVHSLIGGGVDRSDPELLSAQQVFVVGVGDDVGPAEFDHLPPLVSSRTWPPASEVGELAALVQGALLRIQETIGQRLERLGARGAMRERIARELALSPPADLRLVPTYHESGLPESIRDAFVGRESLIWELHTALKTQRTGPSVAVLTGVLQGGAGLGKTRLALEYVHRYGPRHYPGGLFWVNADVSHDRLQAQFHGILRALDPGAPTLQTLRENGLRVEDELRQRLLARPPESSVLYVVDNVPEPDPGERPRRLDAWCPVRGLVTLLATSRTSVALGEPVARSLRIGVLSPFAAVEVLTYGYADRSRLDEAMWRRIGEWVGCLPLALTVLNGSLRQKALSAFELTKLAERPDSEPLAAIERQVDALRPLVPAGELRGVTEALEISYRRLQPEAQRAARLLAQLAPEPIPLALLAAFEENVFSSAVRAMLVGRSFITEVRGTPVETFGSMHRLLAQFLCDVSGDRDAETRLACEAMAKVMTWDACKDPNCWPLLAACRPHAEHLFQYGSRPPPDLHGESFLNVGANLGYLLRMQGHWRESVEVRSRVVALASATLGDEHPRTMRITSELAGTLRRQGELRRSRELSEQAAEASLRLLGQEHPVTLYAMATLAATLRDQKELSRSRDLAEQVLAITNRQLGPDHADTVTSMGNLAATLRRMGELERARSLEEAALEARRRLHGEEHPETLTAMANLATTLRGIGEVERARRLQESVLEVRSRLLGLKHSDTLRAMDNLATTLRTQGEFTRARELEALVPDERRTWHD